MRKRTFHARKKQAGLSLIELMIALGIAMVVAAITLGIAAQVRADNRVNQLQTMVVHVATQAQALATGTNYEGIDAELLINAQKVPDNWHNDTTINHPFKGTVVVNGTTDGLSLEINNLPVGACNTLLTNTLANFQGASSGSSQVEANDATPQSIAAVCANAPVTLTLEV